MEEQLEMNFEDDVKVEVSEEKLTTLARLATQQLFLEQQIAELEEQVSEHKKMHKAISEGKIPELMGEIGMGSFTLTNGAKIVVEPFYTGTVNDSNISPVSDWLKANGHESLIKKELTLDFGKAEGLDWKDTIASLKTEVRRISGLEVEAKAKQSIHHATLKAFIKEQVMAGNEFPLDLFKAYVGNKTKITL